MSDYKSNFEMKLAYHTAPSFIWNKGIITYEN